MYDRVTFTHHFSRQARPKRAVLFTRLAVLVGFLLAARLLAAAPPPGTNKNHPSQATVPIPCVEGTFGTAVHWTSDLKAARATAKEDNRLVFLIQVSGNFAKDNFT